MPSSPGSPRKSFFAMQAEASPKLQRLPNATDQRQPQGLHGSGALSTGNEVHFRNHREFTLEDLPSRKLSAQQVQVKANGQLQHSPSVRSNPRSPKSTPKSPKLLAVQSSAAHDRYLNYHQGPSALSALAQSQPCTSTASATSALARSKPVTTAAKYQGSTSVQGSWSVRPHNSVLALESRASTSGDRNIYANQFSLHNRSSSGRLVSDKSFLSFFARVLICALLYYSDVSFL